MAPVSGKVTFRDGSLIKADAISVRFVPQDVAAVGVKAPGPASASVNVADGTFATAMTYRPDDGAIVGKHKVMVRAVCPKPGAFGSMRNVIPEKYLSARTTPLEVEVPPGGGSFTLLIDKR